MKSSPHSTSTALVFFAVLGAISFSTGCDRNAWKSSSSPQPSGSSASSGIKSWFGKSKPDGEAWTIECAVYSTDQHAEVADELAAALKNVKELKPESVHVEHKDDKSIIYYGDYTLRRDARSDNVVFSNDVNNDVRFIRTLSPVAGQYPFLAARPVPQVQADTTSPPEWDLRNSNAVYTLQVGVTYNTATFNERVQAAIEWAKDLRSRGFEAYYYHDVNRSIVTIGAFDESAVSTGPDGRPQYSQKVRDLRAVEEFSYNLENGMKTSTVQPDGSKTPNQSFLVRIPRKATKSTGE